MSHVARACAALLLLAPLSCGEIPLEPNAITGVWALESVDHQPVPKVVRNEADLTVLLLADTLTFSLSGSYDGSRCELRVYVAQQLSTTTCRPYSGSYRLRVRTLELRTRCGLAGTCLGSAILSATVEAGRLVVQSLEGPEFSYARVE